MLLRPIFRKKSANIIDVLRRKVSMTSKNTKYMRTHMMRKDIQIGVPRNLSFHVIDAIFKYNGTHNIKICSLKLLFRIIELS